MHCSTAAPVATSECSKARTVRRQTCASRNFSTKAAPVFDKNTGMGNPAPSASPWATSSATKRIEWLGSGEPHAQLIAHLRTRGLELVRPSTTEPSLGPRLTFLGVAHAPTVAPSLSGRRIAVLHPDPSSTDTLAQALRARGAEVVVLSLDPAMLDRFETFTPDAVLLEPSDFIGGCWEIVRALWAHPLLSWSPIVLTPAEPWGQTALCAPDTELICHTVRELSTAYDALLRRATLREPFECALEVLGPARTLRALVASGQSLRVSVQAPTCVIELDLAERIVIGAREATAREVDGALLGPQALAHVLEATQATVRVRRVAAPAETNIMAPLEDALHAARTALQSAEHAPLRAATTSHVTRRAFTAPANDCIATVRPPKIDHEPLRVQDGPPPIAAGAGRVYAFPNPRSAREEKDGLLERGARRPIPPPPMPSFEVEPPKETAQSVAVQSVAVQSSDVPEWEPAELEEELFESSGEASSLRSRAALARAWLHTAFARGQRGFFEMTQVIAAKLGPRASELGERARKSLALGLAWLSVRQRAFAALDRRLRWAVVLLLSLSSATLTWWLMRDDASATTPATTEVEKSELSVQVSKLAPVVPEPEIAPVVPEVVDDTEEAALESEGELDTSRANQLVQEGHAFRAEGKLPRAEERYLEALRTQRAYPRALAALTRLEMMRGNGKGAVRWARMLVRTHPRPATHHLLLGDAFRAAGDLAAARKAWNQARKRGSRVAKNRLK